MPDSSPSAPYALSDRFQNIVAVARSALGDRLQADALADSLGVPNLGVVRPRDIRDFPVLLFLDEQGLGLQMTGKGAPGPVRAEFVTGKMGYRREHGGGAGQLVARAVGLQKTRAASLRSLTGLLLPVWKLKLLPGLIPPIMFRYRWPDDRKT